MNKITLLNYSKDMLLDIYTILEYIKNKGNEKKDFISLEIDKLISNYNSLQNLKKYTNSVEIEKCLVSIRKIIVDLDSFRNKKHIKKPHSTMYINPDKELKYFKIKGKNKWISFGITYTPRPDKYNKLIYNYFELESKDVLSLFYYILVKRFGINRRQEIKEFIDTRFNKKNYLKTTNINELKYVAITIKDSTLNVSISILELEEGYNRESNDNVMNRTYSIYFNPHNRETSIYKNFSTEDILTLFDCKYNNIKYIQ